MGVEAIGIADDWYLIGKHTIAEGWDQMEAVLADYGHRLRRHTCWFWAPALDVLEASPQHDVQGAASTLEAGAAPSEPA